MTSPQEAAPLPGGNQTASNADSPAELLRYGFTADQIHELKMKVPVEHIAVHQRSNDQLSVTLEPNYVRLRANEVFGPGNWSQKIITQPTPIIDLTHDKIVRSQFPSEAQRAKAAHIAGAIDRLPTVEEVSDHELLSAWIDRNKPSGGTRGSKPAQLPDPKPGATRIQKTRFLAFSATVEIEVRSPTGYLITRQGIGMVECELNLDGSADLGGEANRAVKGCVTDATKRALQTFGDTFGAHLTDPNCPHRVRAEHLFIERRQRSNGSNVSRYPDAGQNTVVHLADHRRRGPGNDQDGTSATTTVAATAVGPTPAETTGPAEPSNKAPSARTIGAETSASTAPNSGGSTTGTPTDANAGSPSGAAIQAPEQVTSSVPPKAPDPVEHHPKKVTARWPNNTPAPECHAIAIPFYTGFNLAGFEEQYGYADDGRMQAVMQTRDTLPGKTPDDQIKGVEMRYLEKLSTRIEQAKTAEDVFALILAYQRELDQIHARSLFGARMVARVVNNAAKRLDRLEDSSGDQAKMA